ncbi:hypothetical protein VPH35_126561 [Triticum aestivum]
MFFSTKTCIATIMVLALVLAHQGVCRCMRDHRLVDHESTVARNSLVSPQIACPEGQVWIGKFGHCSVK